MERSPEDELERMQQEAEEWAARQLGEQVAGVGPYRWRGPAGYEYRSEATWMGLPLVHIAFGFGPDGRPLVARGVVASGGVAIGVLALGGVALGGVTLGGVSLGLLALGGLALGYGAAGGMAIALWLAIGGLAISAQYAIGGLALAPHALGGNAQDPLLLRWLEEHLHLRWMP